MIIHLTKKLADKLKLSPAVETVEDDFFSWRANYQQGSGERFVLLMNDASRFSIVINNAKVPRLKKLPELFVGLLRDALLSLGVNPEVVERYIEESGEITYAKNSDRKKTAQLNKNMEAAWWALYDSSDDLEMSLSVNEMIYNTSGADECVVPNEKMLELLSKYELPVRKFRAYDLKVRLDLGGKDAVRRLRVPANISFERLHETLQEAFGWSNYHLYSFGMFKKWSTNYYATPDVELVMSEEYFEANPDAIIMTGLKLSDFTPKYSKILYTYDFGDDWHHYIEVEGTIDDCTEDLPRLLSGEGDAPPEDVGGSGGFAEFLDILADPSHEGHEEAAEWAKSIWWRPFDFAAVARRVNPRDVLISGVKKAGDDD